MECIRRNTSSTGTLSLSTEDQVYAHIPYVEGVPKVPPSFGSNGNVVLNKA